MREEIAHLLGGAMGHLSPWWRFRIWARVAGPAAYRTFPDFAERPKALWPHGFTMLLRDGDWMERYSRRSGRFYQDDLIATVLSQVQSGHTFVDVGANLGFVTLTAAHAVGVAGRVVSIEPNKALVERLRRTIALNGLTNVTIHNVALGDADGEIGLVVDAHHGNSHIGVGSGDAVHVPLKRGDELIGDPIGPVFVKIDVEGAEGMVLRGLPKLLARSDVKWLIEICPEHLARFGVHPNDIFEVMFAAGYSAFLPSLSLLSRHVHLKPLSGPTGKKLYDVLFARTP